MGHKSNRQNLTVQHFLAIYKLYLNHSPCLFSSQIPGYVPNIAPGTFPVEQVLTEQKNTYTYF